MYSSHYTNSWGIVIGIDRYKNFSPLSYACSDADSVRDILTSELGFPVTNIVLLKDAEATRATILREYLALSDKASVADDRVLFFFAGHGMTKKGMNGEIGYLVPQDGIEGDLSSFIRWDDLTRNSDLIRAKHMLFIIDACYGGLAVTRAVTPGSQRFVSDMLQRLSRQVMTAGKADQEVADAGGPTGSNSLFTGHLIEGIRGKAYSDTGILTANILMNYVYQKVSQDTNSEQTPHYGHFSGDGDFVLIGHEGTDDSIKVVDKLVITPEYPDFDSDTNLAPTQVPSFSSEAGYVEPKSANFGRNEFTAKLVEDRGEPGQNFSTSRAYSWLGLLVEPIDQSLSVNLQEESKRLPNFILASEAPEAQYRFPPQIRTTLSSLVLYDYKHPNTDDWLYFVRITKSGNIELGDSYYSFYEWENERTFRYVQLIGETWHFLFAAKNILEEVYYSGGIKFTFNLVGTKNTVLDDFARETGEKGLRWSQRSDRGFLHTFTNQNLFTQEPNISIPYQILVSEINLDTTKEIIVDIADNLGLAYNHQSSPRCFNFNTLDFPWNQFRKR